MGTIGSVRRRGQHGRFGSVVRLFLVLAVGAFAGLLVESSGAGAVDALPPLSLQSSSAFPGENLGVAGAGCSIAPDSGNTVIITFGNESHPNLIVASSNSGTEVIALQNAAWATTLSIPSLLTPGTYYIQASCDSYNTVVQYPRASVDVQLVSPTSTSAAEPVDSISASNVTPGESVTIRASGFTMGEPVTATLHSSPVNLGTFAASGSGAVLATVTIPTATTSGQHVIRLVGSTSGVTREATITVGAELANTGTAIAPAATIAALLLLIGASVLVLGWHRRSTY